MPPKYAQRFARLPEVFTILAAHPNGLPLATLAARVGAPPAELRADLLAFFTADLNGFLGLTRPPTLDFLGPDGSDVDPNDAEVVRLSDDRQRDELGVEYVDARELGLIYNAALALQEIDPDDPHLQGALDVLAETMVGQPIESETASGTGLELLQDAARDHRRVRIVYSRAWSEGVIDRVIDPYRLVQTRRGWEIDAGPPDADGQLRTYLLSNLRSYDVLDESFEPPADLEARLVEQRSTRTVRVRVPHAARWAADMYAEQVTVVGDDEEDVTLDLELLAPVERRVGLLLLAAGADARVVDPPGMISALADVAQQLLAHHRGQGGAVRA
ncbi:WYL domain-containing protein [Nocardioides marmoriginsengisoli]|uniref:WYL domain-containing protein n=1 Tax=Nocardioides marmoriginsengisoli TaxID=661483 RepID=A0A3N0CPJ8_9ACTN|nr:WYL domain-containing protein [Nocardioides marmoriginsengisoli]RNL65394.1 WYL domain-containing protein [Nocardioides marmoriginsengisoli]